MSWLVSTAYIRVVNMLYPIDSLSVKWHELQLPSDAACKTIIIHICIHMDSHKHVPKHIQKVIEVHPAFASCLNHLHAATSPVTQGVHPASRRDVCCLQVLHLPWSSPSSRKTHSQHMQWMPSLSPAVKLLRNLASGAGSTGFVTTACI